MEYYSRILWILFIKSTGVGLAFVTHLCIARILGIREYGTFVYLFGWLSLLVMFSSVGFEHSSIRFLAKYSARNEWALFKGFTRTALTAVFLTASIVASISLIILAIIPFEGIATPKQVSLFLLLIPTVSLQNLLSAFLRGINKQRLAELIEGLTKQLLILALIGFALITLADLKVEHFIFFYIVGSVVALLIGVSVFISLSPQIQRGTVPQYKLREWASSTSALWLSGGAYILQSNLDVIMLGIFDGPQEVAQYGVATRLTGILTLCLASTTIVLSPKVAELHDSKDGHFKMQKTLTEAAYILTSLTVFIGALLMIFGNSLLDMFGNGFNAAYTALIILTLGRIFDAAAGPTGQVLAMTGHHWAASKFLLYSTGLNLGLNLLLIPLLSTNGAAIATAASYIFWNTSLIIYTSKNLKLNPSVFKLPWIFQRESNQN